MTDIFVTVTMINPDDSATSRAIEIVSIWKHEAEALKAFEQALLSLKSEKDVKGLFDLDTPASKKKGLVFDVDNFDDCKGDNLENCFRLSGGTSMGAGAVIKTSGEYSFDDIILSFRRSLHMGFLNANVEHHYAGDNKGFDIIEDYDFDPVTKIDKRLLYMYDIESNEEAGVIEKPL